MPSPLYVQVWHDGQCLQEVPFSGDRVQIGRLPENDLVLNHLSVSRIHAQLERDGNEVMVEDLGSQNGVWLGEQRIAGRAMAPFDQPIRIGQHEIRLRRDSASADVDDSEFPAPMPARLEGPTGTVEERIDARPLPPVVRPGLSGEPSATPATPDRGPGGVTGEDGLEDLSPFAIDEDEIGDDSSLPDGIAELSPEELFDVDDDPTSLVDYPTAETDAISATSDDEARLHPGLIIESSGQIDRVVVWDQDELVAGRGSRCQILLQAPEISRRHARFVREGDRYEVRDLGSINGVFVNGTRVNHHELEVGDVVRIDSFEITFVLDPQPIAEGVQVAAAEQQEISGTDQQHPTRMAESQGAEAAGWNEADASELPEVEAEPSREPEVDAEASRVPGDDLGRLEEAEGMLIGEEAEAGEDESEAEACLEPEEADEPGLDASGAEPVDLEDLGAEVCGPAADEPEEALPSFDLLDEAVSSEDEEDKDEVSAQPRSLELEIAWDALPEPLQQALSALGEDLIELPVRLRVRR